MENNGFLSSELDELLHSCRLERSSDFDVSAYLFAPEHATEYNAARVLCLITTAPQYRIAGKRKLVLLDFLLRDPLALVKVFDRALSENPSFANWMQSCQFKSYELGAERFSLEPVMLRFPLGPFDVDFDKYLSFLLFRGLITIDKEPSSQLNPRQIINATKLGTQAALAMHTDHEHVLARAALLHRVFDGRASGSTIYTYLSENHPELLYGPLWREVR